MLKDKLQSIFSDDYPGYSKFADEVVRPIFGTDFERYPMPVPMEIGQSAINANIQTINRIGIINDNDNRGRNPIEVFDVTINDTAEITRSRVNIQTWIRSEFGLYTHAFIIFHYANPDGRSWRLSYLYKPDTISGATEAKRYTYLLGKSFSARTVTENFVKLASSPLNDNALLDAFSVQALSDEFFDKYRELYADFCQFITGKRYVKENGRWVERVLSEANYQYATTFDRDDKLVRDYIKKMFGRIVFLYFLQRKGWLDGNRQYMHDLFANSTQKDNFLDGVLEPLFFEVLNTDKPYRTEAARALPGSENIPYLNGGLFAQDEIDALDCIFPEIYFKSLFDFLDSYNFTIDENDTDDAEVGIDPEMLGRIFENLLEDNKDKGAFYTPKEIVDYMCRESIIAYLQDERFSEDGNSQIRRFVETMSRDGLSDKQREFLRDKLKAVKICDPAIGSGAFPIGLVNLLSKLYIALGVNASQMPQIKRHIIEQNIYGVDIEKGAVDIARLRFWLAMIVEEEKPMPLPNLHFKIMQGNSLLESYEGRDLSNLSNAVSTEPGVLDFDSLEKQMLQSTLHTYYSTSDHHQRDRIVNEVRNNIRRQVYNGFNITFPEGFDPSANDQFFLWHTWFSDVFENGGFDIVIGNPPYIEFKNYPVEEKAKLRGYKTAKGKYDIYIPFIEMAVNILKLNGILSYICPTRFLKRDYGKALRQFIRENLKLHSIIDFGDCQIFDNAMTYTGIFNIINCLPEPVYSFRYSHTLDSAYHDVSNNKLNNSVWDFSIGPRSAVVEKISSKGVPLESITEGIIQGIATGKDSVFLLNEDEINNLNIEPQIVKKFLKGKDISPYKISWSKLYVLYPYDEDGKVLSEDYLQSNFPNAYHYLLSQREVLKGRGYFDKSSKLWYELWNQRNPSRFEGIKIITLDNASRNSFCIDTEDYYGTTTVYNIKLSDSFISPYYILGLLNSKLLDFYHKSKSIPQANGFYRYQAIFIKDLPIIFGQQNIQDEIATHVKQIMSGKQHQDMIDKLVYHLYDLTYDEVLIIDPETPISREEYDNCNR